MFFNTKICTQCGEERNINLFYIDDAKWIRNICVFCNIDYSKKWNEKNREKYIAASKKCYKNNREKRIAASKKWKNENVIRINNKMYYKNTCPKNIKPIIESLILIREKNKLLKELNDGR